MRWGLRFRRRFIARAHSGYFGFSLAGNGGSPANVNGYYWSATTNNNNNAFYMSVTPTGSSVTNNNKTNLYSVRCVRSVCARTGKPSF